MSVQIHPSSIVEDGAVLGENVSIGPFCIVGPNVTLGNNVTLKSHVVIDGITTIGDGCEIYAFASIGQPTPDLKYHGEPSRLNVGKNCKIREYVTMNPGTEAGRMSTDIGDNCLFMPGSHVAHDCVIGNNVIMANYASLGGHVVLGDYVILGGISGVHQFVRIGAHAIIGGFTGVDNDVIPYGRVRGERAYLAGLNLVGLERRGFEKEQIRILQKAFNELFGKEGTLDQRIEAVAEDYGEHEVVAAIIEFAREKTNFPLCQPSRKAA